MELPPITPLGISVRKPPASKPKQVKIKSPQKSHKAQRLASKNQGQETGMPTHINEEEISDGADQDPSRHEQEAARTLKQRNEAPKLSKCDKRTQKICPYLKLAHAETYLDKNQDIGAHLDANT